MTDEEIRQLVYKEFQNKTLGTTEQYLEIHQPIFINGLPKIERIDREWNADRIIVYLPVNDEHFFFSIYIDTAKKQICSIGTESGNKVCLRVTSESLTSEKLRSFTKLEATRYFNKGNFKPNGKAKHQFSYVEYIPNPEPDGLEDKLNKLLTFVEQDKEGILTLGSYAKVYVDVTMDFHAGNQLLGNAFIDLKTIKRMSDLNLEINFDFAAWGNPFK